jgi:hypothetical protein
MHVGTLNELTCFEDSYTISQAAVSFVTCLCTRVLLGRPSTPRNHLFISDTTDKPAQTHGVGFILRVVGSDWNDPVAGACLVTLRVGRVRLN